MRIRSCAHIFVFEDSKEATILAIKWPEIQYKEGPDGMLDPMLTFPQQPEGNTGKYGGMRRDYLQQYRKSTFARMSMEGTLKQHLMDVNEQAKTMVDQLVEQMSQSEPMPDKNSNPLGWIQRMNTFRVQAEEIVMRTIVFA